MFSAFAISYVAMTFCKMRIPIHLAYSKVFYTSSYFFYKVNYCFVNLTD